MDLLRGRTGGVPVGFSPRAVDGETALLFPQVNFCGPRSSLGCWAQRTRPEKQLMVLVAVLAAVLAACLLGLIFQYRARKSPRRAGTKPLGQGRVLRWGSGRSPASLALRWEAWVPGGEPMGCPDMGWDARAWDRMLTCISCPRTGFWGMGGDARLQPSAQGVMLEHHVGCSGTRQRSPGSLPPG